MLADQIRQVLWTAVKTLDWADKAPDHWRDVPLEIPKSPDHGHYASNFAFRFSKDLRRAPIQIAEQIAAAVDTTGVVAGVEAVKPGFLNIRVSEPALRAVAAQVRAAGDAFGKTDLGSGRKVQVEFVSANPTGPLSVGHGRLAAYGDSLARILSAAGFEVQKEFYVNDVGNQIARLKESGIKKSDELFLDRKADFNDDDYRGEYMYFTSGTTVIDAIEDSSTETKKFLHENLKPEHIKARELSDSELERIVRGLNLYFRQNPTSLGDYENIFKHKAKEKYVPLHMEQQSLVLKRFNITFDRWFRESELYAPEDDGLNQVERTLNMLRDKGEMYEKDGAVWFATEKYLDDKDRVVQKSDGNKTYLMSDIAYIYNKLGVRKFDTAIYVWGADHHGYINRIKSAGMALGFGPDQLEVLIVQLVSIKGERMSKRRGNIIYLDELIEDVGADATRFFFLTRPPGTHCDFDMDLARDKSENNPMYYLQYAHARLCSMIAKAVEAGLEPDDSLTDRLAEPVEMELLRMLADFPWEVQGAAVAREPHRIINYLTALAGKFHSFYHDYKVIQPEDEPLSRARLALCDAVRTVFRNALATLGISAPEKM